MAKQQAFNKAACFTDLHIGNKSNSPVFNQDCIDYTDWFLQQATDFGAETCIFLGDFFHNRSTLNVASLNVGLTIIERIARHFEHTYALVGNHDMYYRDRRDINSVEIARNIPNVTIVHDVLQVGDTAFVPWLVGDEWRSVKKLKNRYIFGHFELPHFLMNAMVTMPAHAQGLDLDDFSGTTEYVFSGHFHKRQFKKNIIYLGNSFPHNYADVGDDQRGCMLLEHGKEPIFENWSQSPIYRDFKISALIANPGLIQPKMYTRVALDIDLNFEELAELKQYFLSLGAREIQLLPILDTTHSDFTGELTFQSADQIVIEGLGKVDSATIRPEYLIEIYQGL